MGLANEALFLLFLTIAIMLVAKGSMNLAKIFFGFIPAPQGLREALAA